MNSIRYKLVAIKSRADNASGGLCARIVSSKFIRNQLYEVTLTDGDGHYLQVIMSTPDFVDSGRLHYDCFITNSTGEDFGINYQNYFDLEFDSQGRIDSPASLKELWEPTRHRDKLNPWVHPLVSSWISSLDKHYLDVHHPAFIGTRPIEFKNAPWEGTRSLLDIAGRVDVPVEDFELYDVSSDYFMWNLARVVLSKVRAVMARNGFPLVGRMDPENNCREGFSAAWMNVYHALAYMSENLEQHEYVESSRRIYLRVTSTRDPIEAVLVELYGPGGMPLPKELTAQTCFTTRSRPWDGSAPAKARSPNSGEGRAVMHMFNTLSDAERIWGLSEENLFRVGWRKAQPGEGPLPYGHVISLLIPGFGRHSDEDTSI